MHRIVFTGAQGTGKTTVLKEFEKDGFNVITEVVRQLNTKGVKINKDGDEKGQNKIFKTYKDLLSQYDANGYISDRCLVDVLAYTMHLADHGQVSKELVEKQFKQLMRFKSENPDVIYCYFPIEFDVVDDGVRDTDEDYRKEIDANIVNILRRAGITPVVMRGSVEDRKAKVNLAINWVRVGVSLFDGV